MKLLIIITVACLAMADCLPASQQKPDVQEDKMMHRHRISKRSSKVNNEEENTEYWNQYAQNSLNSKLSFVPNTGVAKNVILFMGDGMSIPTIAASRVYMGNLLNVTGENLQLSFEKFEQVGLSKTYCVDKQVADSACSATAYLCGVKGNMGTIGVNGKVPEKNCQASVDTATHVDSIARWSQLHNKRTGFVTTTRVTHASPAGVYAKTAFRDWEADSDLAADGVDFNDCPDIAYQLIHGTTGKNLNVIMGGGHTNFIPTTKLTPSGKKGKRLDGKDLVEEWKTQTGGSFVTNKAELDAVPNSKEHVMGLYAASHLNYYLDKDPEAPTLPEMVEKAINLLSQGDNGFFLFVEGGRIDHAHHDNEAQRAFMETLQFSEAIAKANEMMGDDTLIVVTSDHAHVMSLAGYADRGNDILGQADVSDVDGIPYSTITYANGPGYKGDSCNGRYDPSQSDKHVHDYKFPTEAPLVADTHGGDDVGIFARGPWAHLLTGVNEQNLIPHIMAYASCVGNGVTVCDTKK